jgi:hypothetical protein
MQNEDYDPRELERQKSALAATSKAVGRFQFAKTRARLQKSIAPANVDLLVERYRYYLLTQIITATYANGECREAPAADLEPALACHILETYEWQEFWERKPVIVYFTPKWLAAAVENARRDPPFPGLADDDLSRTMRGIINHAKSAQGPFGGDAQLAIAAFRDYMAYMTQLAANSNLGKPSATVAKAWELHLQCTQCYSLYCQKLFRQPFVHYNP